MISRTLTNIFAAGAITLSSWSPSMSQEPISTDEFRAIAEEAYIYAFPMIVGYKVLHDYNIDRDSGEFKAPFNQISSEARVFTPADTTVSTPNSDTPYSLVQLDLRAEPMVLCMPEIEASRYYDVQLADMYTQNYGYMGSRTTGNDAGCFMVTGPEWSGEAPAGIEKTFRSETEFSFVIYRTQLFNPADMPNVVKIQAAYTAQPLSAFTGQPAPAKAPEVDWPAFSRKAFSTAFPDYLSFLLQFAPATGTAAVEQTLREKFAKIGITAGTTFDASTLSAEQQAALVAAIKTATAKITKAANSIGVVVNGWQIGAAQGDRAFYSGNWVLRAAAAKNGIYGNNPEEATYPFARNDMNGVVLDGSRHDYTMTFAPDALPPVNAFWSVTMYDNNTMLLIDNPINRYLINSPMLKDLKKNADGSLTIYIQHDSPGKERESNWLPAPDGPMAVVLRLYWPKTEAPSVLPAGKGSWQPPTLVPVTDKRAEGIRRPGDKSRENIVRTDERYGGDPLFQGPRGWSYWKGLEYPKPIQNPNLWPDTQSTYFLARLAMSAGSTLTLRGAFPRSRYFNYALYLAERGTFVSTGESIAGKDITPDPGSTNPFRVGADRLAEPRDYTLSIVAKDVPKDPSARMANTLYAGAAGGELELIIRIYLPDQGSDGAGWGSWASASGARGLPTYEGTLADGTHLTSEQVAASFGRPFVGGTAQPMTAAQWIAMVNAKDNDPTLDPATAPARREPKWEKFWTLRYTVLGAFKPPAERAKIPFAGAMEGGGDPATQYLVTWLSRKFGPVYVMRGKMPIFPNTYAGAAGRGLEVMPEAQTRYWSLVSAEAAPSGQIVDGLTDMQVPLDADRNYTIVVSRKEDRPANATLENGVAWLEWSERGEGLNDPHNRSDFGMLMLRIMANDPAWAQSPNKVVKPGTEASVMGPYLPQGEYTDKATFEAKGP